MFIAVSWRPAKLLGSRHRGSAFLSTARHASANGSFCRGRSAVFPVNWESKEKTKPRLAVSALDVESYAQRAVAQARLAVGCILTCADYSQVRTKASHQMEVVLHPVTNDNCFRERVPINMSPICDHMGLGGREY
jgi:hypothetical protein